jgi:hypothetical protein
MGGVVMSANSKVRRSRPATTRKATRPSTKGKRRKSGKAIESAKTAEVKKKSGLGKFLSPQNIQESLKSVGNLRSMVKNWLGYLQQADTLLDTVYATSNSLKDSGVLEKIVKQRGKNMTTDDFTSILIALMNSPVGSQVLKSMGSKSDGAEEVTTTAQQESK